MNAFVSSGATPPPLPARPTRSVFVTVLAWILIVGSALLLPISLMTLLMLVAHSDGTAHASLSDAIFVIGRPPATLLAGIGLLRRWRWAHRYTLVLLVTFAAWNAMVMLRGPTAEHTYTSSSGVPTTVLSSSVNYSWHLAVAAVVFGVLVKLLDRSVRADFSTKTHLILTPARR